MNENGMEVVIRFKDGREQKHYRVCKIVRTPDGKFYRFYFIGRDYTPYSIEAAQIEGFMHVQKEAR
jgi:hypothetical protein